MSEIIVKRISNLLAEDFINYYHYAGMTANNYYKSYAAFKDGLMIAVFVFANATGSLLAGMFYGPEENRRIKCLQRMAAVPFEDRQVYLSQLLMMAIKEYVKDTDYVRGIISYADTTFEHHGGVYQSCNFFYTGTTANKTGYSYLDQDGKLRTERGPNGFINELEARELGWIEVNTKHKERYFLPVGRSKREKKIWTRKFINYWNSNRELQMPAEYPKPGGD